MRGGRRPGHSPARRGPGELAQHLDASAQQLGRPRIITHGEVDLSQAVARARPEQGIAQLVGDGDGAMAYPEGDAASRTRHPCVRCERVNS